MLKPVPKTPLQAQAARIKPAVHSYSTSRVTFHASQESRRYYTYHWLCWSSLLVLCVQCPQRSSHCRSALHYPTCGTVSSNIPSLYFIRTASEVISPWPSHYLTELPVQSRRRPSHLHSPMLLVDRPIDATPGTRQAPRAPHSRQAGTGPTKRIRRSGDSAASCLGPPQRRRASARTTVQDRLAHQALWRLSCVLPRPRAAAARVRAKDRTGTLLVLGLPGGGPGTASSCGGGGTAPFAAGASATRGALRTEAAPAAATAAAAEPPGDRLMSEVPDVCRL